MPEPNVNYDAIVGSGIVPAGQQITVPIVSLEAPAAYRLTATLDSEQAFVTLFVFMVSRTVAPNLVNKDRWTPAPNTGFIDVTGPAAPGTIIASGGNILSLICNNTKASPSPYRWQIIRRV